MRTGIFWYSSYMKAKEWAKANGFPDISLGKGRMPNDARAAVEAYVASGGHLEGYTTTSTAAPGGTTTTTVKREAGQTIADIGDETRPEKYNRAFVGTSEVGMRTVCLNCRGSLTYCPCESPRVYVDFDRIGVVGFKSRSNPEEYRNRWW